MKIDVNVNDAKVNNVSTLNFTDDQLKAYNDIIKFISDKYDVNNYKRALVGPAGTGKTYLVKAIIKNCGLSYSTIGLSAPTHKACRVLNESINLRNIKVNTLQSDLGLRINFDVEKFDERNPPFDPKGKIKIGNYKLYIIDESSMINRGLCSFLERICKQNSCKILYIGDSSQLAPVGEKFSSALKGINTNKLTQIVRQEEDNPLRYLLDLLRYDIEHKTFNFLQYISKYKSKFDADNTKGYMVCNTQEFNQIVYNNFNDEQLTKNVDFCKVIAYTNNCVSSWNKFIRNAIIADADKSVLTKNDLLLSYTTIVDQFNDCIITNSEEYIINDIVNYIHPKYGFNGFMVRFRGIHGGSLTQPLFILDHKNIDTIKSYVNISEALINDAKTARQSLKASKWREYYAFKESNLLLTNIVASDMRTIRYSRDLDYGFAMTAHKCQGSTFDTALVDVNDIVYDKFGNPYSDIEETNRRLYVACSRPKNKLYLKFGM